MRQTHLNLASEIASNEYWNAPTSYPIIAAEKAGQIHELEDISQSISKDYETAKQISDLLLNAYCDPRHATEQPIAKNQYLPITEPSQFIKVVEDSRQVFVGRPRMNNRSVKPANKCGLKKFDALASAAIYNRLVFDTKAVAAVKTSDTSSAVVTRNVYYLKTLPNSPLGATLSNHSSLLRTPTSESIFVYPVGSIYSLDTENEINHSKRKVVAASLIEYSQDNSRIRGKQVRTPVLRLPRVVLPQVSLGY